MNENAYLMFLFKYTELFEINKNLPDCYDCWLIFYHSFLGLGVVRHIIRQDKNVSEERLIITL